MVNITKPPQLDMLPIKPLIYGAILLVVLISAGFFLLDFLETRQAEKAQQEQALYQEKAKMASCSCGH